MNTTNEETRKTVGKEERETEEGTAKRKNQAPPAANHQLLLAVFATQQMTPSHQHRGQQPYRVRITLL